MAIKRAAPGASATGNKKARAKTPAAKGKAAATSKGKRPAKLADSDNESASASDPDDDGPDAVWGADVQELEQRTIEQTYQKKSQLEHILLRPDTYIGSVEPITQTLWVYDSALNGLQYREATVVPGLYKIYDEILVNAADNKIRDPSMNTIKVTIDAANNVISIMNNGKGIPVEIHKDEKMYVPELIFGHLLTSSNYDDDQKKVTGGRNGYGAKLCNIFSKEFIVETADKVSGRKFKQVFRDNMSQRGDPVITANTRKEEFTKITFRPDLAKFHMEAMDDDIIALFKKRVYDMAGTMVGVNVYLNGEKIRIKNFQEYVMMYLTAPEAPKPGSKAAKAAAGAKANGGTSSAKSEPGDETDAGGDTEATEAPSSTAAASEEGPIKPTPTIIHEVVNSRWEVVFAVSEGQFQQVSFVNGICTSKGGTHVNHVADQITTRLAEVLKKKHKAQIKPFQIKSQMWLFINCLIENPSFDSQTKENMTLRPSAFGSKCEPSEKFYKKVIKSDIVENVLSYAKFKLDQQLKKTDGTSRQRLIGIDKLDDATKAGTRESQKCTLVLTEGDSARSLALSGFEVVGKEYYGVYPLRGKVLNVRCAKASQILDNKELSNIKRILGLKHGTTEDASKLRYGHLMIMTDQDHDGSHIKGLIINFLDFYYPNLLRTPGFLLEFVTPIVRATKGKDKKDFFTIPEYETWCKTLGGQVRSWHSKYFKGLGTSDASDAKRYFADLPKHRKEFAACDPEDRRLLDMVFNQTRADERKEWLRQLEDGTYLDHDQPTIRIADFVNRELILFSMADNVRSIPSMLDGFKPGQRKVLFTCIKRNYKKEIRVSQLAAQVAADTHYKHGEESLAKTVIGMAQDFVGSNNINILSPNGQFGTRIMGGDDSASPRYLNTLPNSMARIVYHPKDDHLLDYLKDDNDVIEPKHYMPVVPMVLMNNANGIGTGWSTSIPSYNPVDIVNNIRRLMNGEEMSPMSPWYRGFNGSITRESPDRYRVSGIIRKIDDDVVEVSELPIRVWNESYKQLVESWCVGTAKVKPFVKDYVNYSGIYTVKFVITLNEGEMAKAEAEGLEKRFRVATTISTSNMICFDRNHRIQRYATPEAIIQEFYDVRLTFYQRRKEWILDQLTQDWTRLDNRVRFILEIIEKKLIVQNRRKADIIQDLEARGYTPMSKDNTGTKRSLTTRSAAEEEEVNDVAAVATVEDATGQKVQSRDYDYLLSMPIYNLTREKVEQLLADRDRKQAEVDVILKTTPMMMWNQDLDAFLVSWEEKLEYHERQERETMEAREDHKRRQKSGKAKARAKSKVKKESDDDDGEDDADDYAPTKKKPAAAKTSAAASKSKTSVLDMLKQATTAPPDATRKVKPDPDEPATRPAARRPVAAPPILEDDDDDDDDDELALSLTDRMNKLLAARKRKPVDSDDEDFANPLSVVVTKPAPTAPAKRSPAKRSKSDAAATITSAAIELDTPPPAKPGRRAPAKKAAPRRAIVDSDDDEAEDADSIVGTSPVAKAKPAKAAPARKKAVAASSPAAKPAAARKRSAASSVLESPTSSAVDDSPVVARTRPARTARAARQPAKYVEISDSDDGVASNDDGSEADFDGGGDSD